MIRKKIKKGDITIGKLGIYLNADTTDGEKIRFSYVKRPELRTVGVNSLTEDQMFCLFMDFDSMNEAAVRKQLLFVHERCSVSHFLLLRTSKDHYHAISFEKFLLHEVRSILDDTMVDYRFRNVGMTSDKGWILRLLPKYDEDGDIIRDRPEFVDLIVMSRNPRRRLSRAHVELYAKLFPDAKSIMEGADAFKDEFLDGSSTVKLVRYGTSHADLEMEAGLDEMVRSRRLRIRWEDDFSL